MDAKSAFEAIEAIRRTVPAEELQVLGSELVTQFGLVAEATGTVAVSETTTIEAPTLTPESLLETLDTAYKTYGFLVDTPNERRAAVKVGRKEKRPQQLELANKNIIKAEVEALLANEDLIAELQTEVDYFTANPEADSPEAGFDLMIVPEGLTSDDDQATAKVLQAKITTQYKPYIRPDVHNDPRTPEITGKGYRIVFAPRHYNVPEGTTTEQTTWMKTKNKQTTVTQLETATDAEAMAQINNLQDTSELNDPSTRYDKNYFRRFDQAPHADYVSEVGVSGSGMVDLGRSNVHRYYPARALVVPVEKLKAFL